MSASLVEVLITEEQLRRRIPVMAAGIAARLAEIGSGEPLVVGLCKGAFVFTADLVRELSRHGVSMEVDFMVLTSYGKGQSSSGSVAVRMDGAISPEQRTVLLVDDILDSGVTLNFAVDHLRRRGAHTILTAVLLDKPERRQTPFQADFTGFTIPNRFVVGYGIDYAERYRELPYVGCLP